MRYSVFTCTLLLALLLAATGCEPTPPPAPEPEPTGFDAALAEELGADPYGMKTYVMALLKPGPNRDQDAEEAQRLQAAHLANIRRMAEEGDLVLAGPFFEGDVQGIYVFDVATVEEARALTETDPAVQAGRLVMDLRRWYGPAALQMLSEIHLRIAAENP